MKIFGNTALLSALIVISPLAGFLVNGLIAFIRSGAAKKISDSKKASQPAAQGSVTSAGWNALMFLIALTSVLVSFGVSMYFLVMIVSLGNEGRMHVYFAEWFSIDRIQFQFAFLLDFLSVSMAVLVSLISLFVHIYSADYMKKEEGFGRYFAVLNLFTAMMLILVLADNIMLLFLGWEGVGFCSYLLIGFYYKKREASSASFKAFIVNRTGDFAFLTGILLLIFFMRGTGHFLFFDYDVVNQSLSYYRDDTFMGLPLIGTIAFLFFAGITAKSAQIPLYIWLPDAMAGPTPVSALIHAATMVTAGIFLVLRISPFFLAAHHIMDLIAVTGGVTSVGAGILALFQYDVKKVLAYSTISQLGFIFLSLGTGGLHQGYFHLITHAFFKAVLFLAAGSVLLQLHHEGDMRKMGGLFRRDKITGAAYLISALSISGIFPFSGFFSKDMILIHLFENSKGDAYSNMLFILGLAVTFITPLYIFRQYFMIFAGTYRGEKFHDQETMFLMKFVLLFLSGLSLLSGMLNFPLIGETGFLTDALRYSVPFETSHVAFVPELIVASTGLSISLFSIFLSWKFYEKGIPLRSLFSKKMGWLYAVVAHNYYIEEFYIRIIAGSIIKISRLTAAFDRLVIDAAAARVTELTIKMAGIHDLAEKNILNRAVEKLANASRFSGKLFRNMQTGYLYNYLHYILGGVLIVGSMMIWLNITGNL